MQPFLSGGGIYFEISGLEKRLKKNGKNIVIKIKECYTKNIKIIEEENYEIK